MSSGALADQLRALGLQRDQEVFVRGALLTGITGKGLCSLRREAQVVAEEVTIRP